jgi:hypothetical protein
MLPVGYSVPLAQSPELDCPNKLKIRACFAIILGYVCDVILTCGAGGRDLGD